MAQLSLEQAEQGEVVLGSRPFAGRFCQGRHESSLRVGWTWQRAPGFVFPGANGHARSYMLRGMEGMPTPCMLGVRKSSLCSISQGMEEHI